jgi:hypothetical protein
MDGAPALASAPAIGCNVLSFEMAYTRHADRKQRKKAGITTANPPQRAQQANVYGLLKRTPRYRRPNTFNLSEDQRTRAKGPKRLGIADSDSPMFGAVRRPRVCETFSADAENVCGLRR